MPYASSPPSIPTQPRRRVGRRPGPSAVQNPAGPGPFGLARTGGNLLRLALKDRTREQALGGTHPATPGQRPGQTAWGRRNHRETAAFTEDALRRSRRDRWPGFRAHRDRTSQTACRRKVQPPVTGGNHARSWTKFGCCYDAADLTVGNQHIESATPTLPRGPTLGSVRL